MIARLLASIAERLVNFIITRAKRTPYFHLPGYMERYWLLKPRRWLPFSIRVHHILRSDLDRHLHDHPWASCSIILRGGYLEILPLDQSQSPALDVAGRLRRVWRAPGDVILRSARTRHRLHLQPHKTCWSLFLMWRREGAWGFYVPNVPGEWVWSRDYFHDYAGTSSDAAPTRKAA